MFINKKLIMEFKSGNSTIYYSVSGAGPTLMLVHGFGEDGSIWNNLKTDLEKQFTLLIPDLAGSGESPLTGGGTAGDHSSLEAHAALLHEILEQEKIDRCVMIGHSMGGYITLAFANKWPDMLQGFGLFHSSAFADNEEKKNTRLKAIDFINENGAAAFLKTAIPNLFGDDFKTKHTDVVEETIKHYSYFTPEALTSYYFAMIERPDRTDVLENFPKPVLFIIGEKDTAIPLEASLRQCHIPKQSHVHILTDVGHMGMLEAAEETKKMVSDFTRECLTGD